MFDPVNDPRVQSVGESGCWIWNGWVDSHGYAHVTRGPRATRRHLKVHRLQMEAVLGRILSADECVCHRCDITMCINPDHLFVGTHADNMGDMAAKQRAAMGEAHGSAKLTADQVRRIFLSRGLHRDIAAQFGVKRECVDKIKRGDRWRHVTQNLALPANSERGGTLAQHINMSTRKQNK